MTHGVSIKRGEVIFSISFRRSPYWYHLSILMNQISSDKELCNNIHYLSQVLDPQQQSTRMLAYLT